MHPKCIALSRNKGRRKGGKGRGRSKAYEALLEKFQADYAGISQQEPEYTEEQWKEWYAKYCPDDLSVFLHDFHVHTTLFSLIKRIAHNKNEIHHIGIDEEKIKHVAWRSARIALQSAAPVPGVQAC